MTNLEKFIEMMNKTFNARMTKKNLEMSCSPCGTLKKFECGCSIFDCSKCEAWWDKEWKPKEIEEKSLKKSKPCKYCDEETEYITFLQNTADLGFAGTIEAGVALSNCRGFPAKLHISLWHENTEGTGSSTDEDEVVIKYCPFCGRRIGNGE